MLGRKDPAGPSPPAPLPACGRKRLEEENEGARLAPSCSPSQHERMFKVSGVRLRGFTLVELMVVMVLIALLLTIAVPRYFGTIDTGKQSVQRQNISAIRDAIDKYYGDQGKYPEALQDLVDKKYLRSVPVDPVTQLPNWVIVPPTDPNLTGVYDIRSAKVPDGGTNASGS